MMHMLVAACLCAAAVATVSSAGATKYPNQPWPLPRSMELGNRTVVLHPNLSLACSPAPHCDPAACGAGTVLGLAFERSRPRLTPKTARLPRASGEVVMRRVVVCIKGTADRDANAGGDRPLPGPDTDESYSLRVPAGGGGGSSDDASAVTIEAESVFGSLLALESLQQLLAFTAGLQNLGVENGF